MNLNDDPKHGQSSSCRKQRKHLRTSQLHQETSDYPTHSHYDMLKNSTYTQSEIKLAYQIVQADLFNSLLKTKDGESIHFGKLGKFTKSERQQKCGWDKQNYVYANIHFKPFSKLKSALNEQIVKKYRLK